MSMSDPIADMLTRIRNATASRHDAVTMPASKMKLAIAGVLKSEGFIRDFEMPKDAERDIKIHLRYSGKRDPVVSGLKRISRPGRRVYFGKQDVPEVLAGLGTSILTTSRGVMTGRAAVKAGVGGEILCNVW